MSSPIATGSIVAGFRVESLIGKGAMGAVYLAEEASTKRQIALKLLAPELARNERFRQRFLRESQLAATLDHPNIVPIVSSGEEGGSLYLAMAYVDGSDLRELLRRDGRLEPGRTVHLLEQVAEALDAAHEAALVHRDVKPGNILVAEEPDGEHAYLCDFGLARHVSSVGSLTGDRGFVGTIDYVPPEQIKGGTIDPRADQYALGCVLYECLAGARPFERDSELAVVYAHLNESPPLLADVGPELAEPFDAVIQTALAKSPDDRFSSCGELAEAAGAALRGRVRARSAVRRKRRILGLAGLLAATAVAVAAVLASRPTETPPTISQTAIDGVRLGVLHDASEQAWGPGGAIRPLTYPPQYSRRAFDARKLAVYYDSGVTEAIQDGLVGAVEITTWNKDDRTDAGVGPCSTVDELKAAYGANLKPVEANIQDGKVFGYTVGPNLFFAVDANANPAFVGSVALYSNPLQFAGFNALGDGPCT